MEKVINSYGKEVDYNVAVSFMDDEIREQLHAELVVCRPPVSTPIDLSRCFNGRWEQ